MKEKPILFSGDMVRAILTGRKTQTRRVIKSRPILPDVPYSIIWKDHVWGKDFENYFPSYFPSYSPYGSPGDQLWVREAYSTYKEYDHLKPSEIPVGSKIFCEAEQVGCAWHVDCGKVRPSIFMCRWMSRIQLEVKNVRVEQLHEITDTAAIAEGIDRVMFELSPRDKFMHLWDKINAKRGYSWDSNPWVWVVEFERIKP